MIDIAANRAGSDIDFSDKLASGIAERRQAAFSRVSNEVTYGNADYGIDLVQELGKTGGVATIGIRAAAAIMNDEGFASAGLSQSTTRQVGDVAEVSLSFDAVTTNGSEVSLDVLVANGEVSLVT